MKTAIAAAVLLALAGCGGGGASSSAPMQQVKAPPLRSNVITFMGDSITQYWGPTLKQEPFAIVDVGVAGQQTSQMLARFQHDVIDAQPTVGVVVIDGGINDFRVNHTANIDNVAAMAGAAHDAGIRVIIGSLMLADAFATQAQIESFNSQLITLCADNGYTYADYYDEMLNTDGTEDLDLYKDGVHPNAEGYARMWTVLEPLLDEVLQ